MDAPAHRSADLLARIAAVLNRPVEACSRTHPDEAALEFARMIADPAGRRLVAAFAALTAQSRAGLANVAEAIVAVVPQGPRDHREAMR